MITIFGRIAATGDVAAWSDEHGLVAAVTYSSFRRDLDHTVPLTIDHRSEHTVGELVYAELSEANGDLCGVCVADVDEIGDLGRSIYFSGTFVSTGLESRSVVWVGRDAKLVEVGLTYTPARFAQPPVQILPGTIASGFDRRQWDGPASRNPILGRAAASVEERRHHSWPLELADLRPSLDERSVVERTGIPIRRDDRGRMIVTDEQGRQHTVELEHR